MYAVVTAKSECGRQNGSAYIDHTSPSPGGRGKGRGGREGTPPGVFPRGGGGKGK